MAKALEFATGPIAEAVAPLKNDAIARAEKEANALIAHLTAKLAEVDNDLEKLAPYPSPKIGKAAYRTAINRRHMIETLAYGIAERNGISRRPGSPYYVEMNAERCAKFIEVAKADAGFQYDSFVCKLVRKIGETTAAMLTGNHVWGFSILTVTLPDGEKQNWKTQQIVNISKLHKLFNQWPTRKVK